MIAFRMPRISGSATTPRRRRMCRWRCATPRATSAVSRCRAGASSRFGRRTRRSPIRPPSARATVRGRPCRECAHPR